MEFCTVNVLHREKIKQTINMLKNYLHYIYVFYCCSSFYKRVHSDCTTFTGCLNTQYRGEMIWGVFSVPCSRAAAGGTACTASSPSSSWAACVWRDSYGGSWAGISPSSECAAPGRSPALAWSLTSGKDSITHPPKTLFVCV